MKNSNYDFSGWCTKNDLKCSDGRVIRHNAFKNNDGKVVPLVWNHEHNDPTNVLGHAVLEHRDEGVYAYGYFNDTEKANTAKACLTHGDIAALSIWAGKLKSRGHDVMHGDIKEVSLVLAGANPGALIEDIIVHGDDESDEAIIYTGEPIYLCHGDEHANDDDTSTRKDVNDNDNDDDDDDDDDDDTVADILDTMTEKQLTCVYALVGQALEQGNDQNGGDNSMKHNVFENEIAQQTYLSHSDQEGILACAKSNNVGSLQAAIEIYNDETDSTLAHGFDDSTLAQLFPDPKDLMPGAPEAIPENNGWVTAVMQKIHKSPFSRIRTRQADVTAVRAMGYGKKGTLKKETGNIKLVTRSTDPQTVYIKDKLNRDDIIDITDFDVVAYQYAAMKQALNEEIATAILIGDGRDDGDEQKINEDRIRPIWTDDELYTIHHTIDTAAIKATLQGSETANHFGDDFVYTEAVISAALFAREKYKGSGAMDFFCTPHMVNRMLLARDMNGRRIYSSESDLAAALNVKHIYTVEDFEGKVRTDESMKKKNLLGIFVNLADYNVGSAKNGAIASFNQFDIDFNQEKYLIETRLSGALTRVKSAIVIEEAAE